jgi:hypothetical protein
MARTKKTRSRHTPEEPKDQPGLGPDSAGQSGDLQGLAEVPKASPESVEELVEEGQSWEAAAVEGVEDAEDADGNPAEVRTHEVPEDDVPEEYTERD